MGRGKHLGSFAETMITSFLPSSTHSLRFLYKKQFPHMTATNAAVSSRQRGMSTPSHDHVPGLPRPQSSRPEGHDLDFADMSIPGQDTEEASIHAVSPFLVAKPSFTVSQSVGCGC